MYKICPHCGAHLDPCERCDCIKRAAPGVASTEDGKNVSTDIKNVSEKPEKIKPKFPTMAEVEAAILDLTAEERAELYEMCKTVGLIKEV